MAGDFPAGVDDLAHRVPVAGAEIEDAVRARLVGAQRQQMGVGEILDVDVVAHGGAVGRRPVGAEDHDLVPVAQSNLQHQRNEVRFHHAVLAVAVPGAGDVEVAQARRTEAIRASVRRDGVVDGQLRGAVGVGRRRGHVLGDRHLLRLAVRGGRGGEDQIVRAGVAHRVEQRQRGAHVAVPVLRRNLDGLADQGPRRKMQHAVELAVGQHVADDVGDVGLDELGALRHPVTISGRQVVEDRHLVPLGEKHGGVDAADVPCAARYQEFHLFRTTMTAWESVSGMSSE